MYVCISACYRLKRLQKDKEVRVVYLRKHSCARTRTLEDTRDMENANLALAEQIERAQTTETGSGHISSGVRVKVMVQREG